ncbi:DUF423 domain-containing protein [Brevundimonas faecalis]|uniref:DUF423 domain-containing protein n=1 Tax=Brevundimonas faecalis TaxID=947378 RepID=UPI00360BD7EF
MNRNRILLAFSAVNGAMAVALGAFAAHGAAPKAAALLSTGAHYQMIHAVLAVACALWVGGGRGARAAGWLAVSGGLVFCLSLAAIALLGLRWMGAVAPIGGTLMIIGWVVLAVAALRTRTFQS